MLYWRKNAIRRSCYLRQSYHLLCLKIPSSISYLAKFIYKQWGDYQKKVDQDSLTSVIHFFKVVILSVIPQSEQKKTTKYKQRYQAIFDSVINLLPSYCFYLLTDAHEGFWETENLFNFDTKAWKWILSFQRKFKQMFSEDERSKSDL